MLPGRAQSAWFHAHPRMSRFLLLLVCAVPPGLTQAPMLQDGAGALRQARLDWTLGQTPLGASSMPSFEAGLGGAGSDGAYAPLVGGEGLGHGAKGWGLGLQGRFVRGGWSFSATALALRDHDRTLGVLQRFAIAFQTESGWRTALEQAPLAWGSGLNGGDLLGDSARPFPRLSFSTPGASLRFGTWRAEAFTGRLESNRTIPEWLPDRASRLAAETAGLNLRNSTLWGGLLRASFGTLVEGSLGVLSLQGGEDGLGQPAPDRATRRASLTELRVRIPALARLAGARGASVNLSRGGAPDTQAWSLAPPRDLAGLQLVWERWDLGMEYAGAAPSSLQTTFTQPTQLAGFSTHGDPLGSAFGGGTITRTVELGLPLFLEGQGRLKAVRATVALDQPSGMASWFIQTEAQWRTPTGRAGGTFGLRRNELPGAEARWGWAFSLFEAFRVF